MSDEAAIVERRLRASPRLMQALQTACLLNLPDWLVFSGAVYQTVWNGMTGRDPDHGIKDYDLGYFDPDVSWDAEDAVIRRAREAYAPPLDALVEVRNQARVHLWFEARFGQPYTPLANTAQALERFASPTFAIGARLEANGSMTLVAPFGFTDLLALRVAPNPLRDAGDGFQRATASAKARWPEIAVVS